MQLTLTVEQRIRVSWFLGNQQGKIADLMTTWDIRKKIELDPDEIEYYTVDAGNGARAINPADPSIKTISKTFELEKAEARELKTRIESSSNFTCFDADWLLPVMAQL